MAAADNEKKHKVTAFLIKDGYKGIEEFLSFKNFRVVPVESGGKEIGTLIYKGGFQSKPTWVSIFEGLQGFDSRESLTKARRRCTSSNTMIDGSVLLSGMHGILSMNLLTNGTSV